MVLSKLFCSIPFYIWRIPNSFRKQSDYNCTVIKLTNTALFCSETKYLYIACTLSSDVGKVNSRVVPIKSTSYSNFTMRTQTLGQFQYCFRLVSFCGSVVIKDFPISKRFNQKRHSHIVTHDIFVPQLECSETFPSSWI